MWFDLEMDAASMTRYGFLLAHLLLLIVSASISFAVPRRPPVYRSGQASKPVDGENTVSVFSRLTLSWANSKLSHAVRHGGLEFEDLSFLSARMSAHALVARFKGITSRERLWRSTIALHRTTLIWQWLLTLVRSFAILAPQYFMYRLISIVEVDSVHPGGMAAGWLILLGLSQLFCPWVEAWSLWVGWCHVALPINMQLSGLVVEKSMRKKDVRDIRSADHDVKHQEFPEGVSDGNAREEEVAEVTSEDSTLVNRQDESNLISVDVQRVSDFLSYNGMSVPLPLGSVGP